jgi:hypothetical protein
MQEQIIVIHPGDTGTGDNVSIFDTPEQAAAHIEDLLEAGCASEGITAYRATPLAMQVRQKPVVSLGQAPTGEMRIPEHPRDEFTAREASADPDLSSALSDLRN